VNITGDYAIIGANNKTVGSNLVQGVVYIFARGSGWATTFTPVAEIAAFDGRQFDQFGTSVFYSPGSAGTDTLFIGTPGRDPGNIAGYSEGIVYMYQGRGSTWTFIRTIQDDRQGQAGFGITLSYDNKNLIIGSPIRNTFQGDVSFLNFQ